MEEGLELTPNIQTQIVEESPIQTLTLKGIHQKERPLKEERITLLKGLKHTNLLLREEVLLREKTRISLLEEVLHGALPHIGLAGLIEAHHQTEIALQEEAALQEAVLKKEGTKKISHHHIINYFHEEYYIIRAI